tara:strand:- start:44 stop:610 length:567 start_codon:yes stop_codon:yes gene_type:complete
MVSRYFDNEYKIQKIFKLIILFTCFIEAKILYDFSENSSLKYWSVIDDGVMGGVSQGILRINYEGYGVFSGYVSLKNYGGFSSIRYNTGPVNVLEYEYISIKVFGDNKDYQLRVRSSYYDRHVYVKKFFAESTWKEILIPLNEMEPYFRGRNLKMNNFKENSIIEIGILIGNKVEEDFTLFIDNISLK